MRGAPLPWPGSLRRGCRLSSRLERRPQRSPGCGSFSPIVLGACGLLQFGNSRPRSPRDALSVISPLSALPETPIVWTAPPPPRPALALMSCSFCCSVFTLLSGRRVAFHNLVLLLTLTSCIYLMAVLCSDRFLCTAPGPSPSVGCHLLSRERPSCFCSGGSFLHVLCFVEMNIFLLVDAFNLYFTSEPLLLCLMVLGSGSEFRRRGQRPSGGPGTWGVGLMPAGFRVARGLCL